MKIEIKRFEELTTNELYNVLQLRSEVFIVEQNCVYQDVDGNDEKALHVLGKKGDGLIAYLRIFKSGNYFENTAIGRVLVAAPSRRNGYAKKLMEMAMQYIFNNLKEEKILLSAQTYLIKFYTDLGFKQEGETYLEDGIPHVKMVYG